MEEMRHQLTRMGITGWRVLEAISQVDRKPFVSEEYEYLAYADTALPLPFGQTISQPFTVARMCELLVCRPETKEASRKKVLEIGTGSGWQTVILSKLFRKVYTVEVIPDLMMAAKKRVSDLGYEIDRIHFMAGDGKEGWVENSPFDGIICGADAQEIPEKWKQQLAGEGRIVCPVKGVMKRVTKRVDRQGESFEEEEFEKYVFVPLV